MSKQSYYPKPKGQSTLYRYGLPRDKRLPTSVSLRTNPNYINKKINRKNTYNDDSDDDDDDTNISHKNPVKYQVEYPIRVDAPHKPVSQTKSSSLYDKISAKTNSLSNTVSNIASNIYDRGYDIVHRKNQPSRRKGPPRLITGSSNGGKRKSRKNKNRKSLKKRRTRRRS